MTRRFTREAWLDFGLERLAAQGPEALKLTDLCAAAKKTIGSFYHHFADQAAFFEAMLDHWKQRNTLDVIDVVQSASGGKSKALHLESIAMSIDPAQETGVRSFSHQNQMAAKVVAEVDATRIDYLASLYAERLALAPDDALALAKLEYAAFVGAQVIWRHDLAEHGPPLSALFRRMIAAYLDTASD